MAELRLRDAAKFLRIVVTGIGVVSPVGRTAAAFWHSLMSNRDAAGSAAYGSVRQSCAPVAAAEFTGRIDDFCDLPAGKRKAIQKSLKLMNRETQMGVAAGQQALEDSGLLAAYDPGRTGICFGAENFAVMAEDFQAGVQACSGDNGFNSDRWGQDGIPEVAPLWLLKCLPNMPACHLAILNDLRGPGNTITQRDVAANMAVAEACRIIRDGDADAMVVGATGTALTCVNQCTIAVDLDIADSHNDVCRPFDKFRRGSVPGEGAGAIVLEEMHSALQRGASIYGEILGAASASCIGQDRSVACRNGLANAMRQTLQRADLLSEQIGHIHAHGLGTVTSDIAEAQAIRQVFGESADRIPVVVAKSHLGNAGAGSGILELIASLLALRNGHLFPVLNFNEPDPMCPVRPVRNCNDAAGSSFLNLNMFGRGLASCVAAGVFRG
ncbi:MAG: beta-ketoacyl-[acyl-carrier-protein] synthase family protein [Planctomycetaceae bacterium]|nr:beta-ketoacyl-[acyl-carrier-protein] synthase family protein [Planctomycetaceae bacterium]